MQADQIRTLFAYDRWATRRILDALDGLDEAAWTRPDAVGDRSLAAAMTHHLGASQRWRVGLASRGAEEGPRPEQEPVPSIADLRARWEAEWVAQDAWLATLEDGFVAYVFEGVPVWQMLVHVVNHGTQHRAEAALLLTAAGRSPSELDLIVWAEALAGRPEPGA